MQIERKDQLAMRGDIGLVGSATRLRAARIIAGVGQQDVADACGIRKTAYSNMETARSYPSRAVMMYFYRLHRVDFNFLMYGDYAQLPGDLLERLWPALLTAANELDRRLDSGQTQDGAEQARRKTASDQT